MRNTNSRRLFPVTAGSAFFDGRTGSVAIPDRVVLFVATVIPDWDQWNSDSNSTEG